MERNEELDRLLEQAADQYQRINANLQAQALQELDRIRAELIEKLTSYTDSSGKISQIRLQSLINDLNTIETRVREANMSAMNNVVEQSAAAGVTAYSEITAGILGVTVADFLGGTAFDRVNQNVFQAAINRYGDDGIVISNRVWRVTREQRLAIQQALTSGVVTGKGVNSIIADVRKVYDNETWKIKRLVVTEGNITYRMASAYTAQQSPYVKALRIHRGKADRPEHRCSQLEKIDRYGYGNGLYKPTDPEVLHPHVNCTSYTTYELIDNVEAVKRNA
jgi:hypothetical protein